MKKVLLSAAICTLSFEMTEGMLERYNPNSGAITRCEDPHALVRANEGNSTIALEDTVNFRMIQPSLLMSEGVVSVLITGYFRTGDTMTQMGDPSERQYPLQRKLLRYEHDLSSGYSYPVEELFVHIDDIEFADRSGDIVLDEEYVDRANGIKHQKRLVRYEMDDEHLCAKQLSEIFITTGSGKQVIDEAKVRDGDGSVSYMRTATPAEFRKISEPESRAGDNEYCYQQVEVSEGWKRPDGSIFVKRTPKVESLAKQRRTVSQYERDDRNLCARQCSEIFVQTRFGERVVEGAKVRPGDPIRRYVRTATPTEVRKIGVPKAMNGDDEFDYQETETSKEYMRPDGTLFVEKIKDWKRVAKPKPPAPVRAEVQYKKVPVFQRKKHGGLFGSHYWCRVGSECVPVTSEINAVYYGNSGDRMPTGGYAPY